MISLRFGDRVEFDYLNWRGETETRLVEFRCLQFGSNKFYPEPQWFLHGVCASLLAVRSFALNRIVGEPRLPATNAAAAAQQEGNAQ